MILQSNFHDGNSQLSQTDSGESSVDHDRAVRRTSFSSQEDNPSDDQNIAKGGVACPFPWKLHDMLDAAKEEGLEDLVSWQTHGRSFTVYKPKEFVEKIMTRFFSQTKYASFQRQLNLYGFSRFAHGPDKGAYYHTCFVRGERSLVRGMVRRKIKGTKVRRTLAASDEPNFYSKCLSADAIKSECEPTEAVTVQIENLALVSSVPPALISSDSAEISDDDSFDAAIEQVVCDGELIFFEGSPFHFLGNGELDLEEEQPLNRLMESLPNAAYHNNVPTMYAIESSPTGARTRMSRWM